LNGKYIVLLIETQEETQRTQQFCGRDTGNQRRARERGQQWYVVHFVAIMHCCL